MKKKLLCLCAALMLTAGCLTAGQAVLAADNADGLSFTADCVHRTEKAYSKEILTFEATINLPANMTSQAGVILGNYQDADNSSYSFEIFSNGNPRLLVLGENGAVMNYVFTGVDATQGKWTHVAIVRDKVNKEVRCYLNGQLPTGGTLPMKDAETTTVIPKNVTFVGGDSRKDNTKYFKGSIRDITVYSDVRTATEVAADAQSTTPLDKEALIAAYQFKSSDATADYIADKSGNGYKLARKSKWMDKGPKIKPYDYSFVVIGDTQTVNLKYNEKFDDIYDYVIDNVSAHKTKFVFGLGDITDQNMDYEWKKAKEQIRRMDNVVPYSLTRGNHDSYDLMNRYFPTSSYKGVFKGSYGDSITDTYQTFSVGELDYLVLCLDVGASDEVLEWAADIIEDHPHHNVIITTHIYMYKDGTTMDSYDPDSVEMFRAENNGDDMWDKLVKHYPNIVLVMSGHVPSDTLVSLETKGVHGNTVRQMLIDHQYVDRDTDGGCGIVCNFYFSNGGRTVQVETYSTIRKQWFLEENQFTFELDVVPRGENAKKDSAFQMEYGEANKPWKTPGTEEGKESEEGVTALNGVKIPKGTYSKSITVGKVQDDTQPDGAKINEMLVPMIIIGVSVLGLATLGIFLYIQKKKSGKSKG